MLGCPGKGGPERGRHCGGGHLLTRCLWSGLSLIDCHANTSPSMGRLPRYPTTGG